MSLLYRGAMQNYEGRMSDVSGAVVTCIVGCVLKMSGCPLCVRVFCSLHSGLPLCYFVYV